MSNTALAIFPQLTMTSNIRTAIQQSRLTNQTTSITNSLDLAMKFWPNLKIVIEKFI